LRTRDTRGEKQERETRGEKQEKRNKRRGTTEEERMRRSIPVCGGSMCVSWQQWVNRYSASCISLAGFLSPTHSEASSVKLRVNLILQHVQFQPSTNKLPCCCVIGENGRRVMEGKGMEGKEREWKWRGRGRGRGKWRGRWRGR
jgi:hypothetical protein